MVNKRTFALGAIGGVGVSVQLALAGRAVASTAPIRHERAVARRPSLLGGDRVGTGSAVVRGDDVADRCHYREVAIDPVAHDGDGGAGVNVGVAGGAV